MSAQIPTFYKKNYNLWKRKIMLIIKIINPLYLGILENGHFIRQTYIPETRTVQTVRLTKKVKWNIKNNSEQLTRPLKSVMYSVKKLSKNQYLVYLIFIELINIIKFYMI